MQDLWSSILSIHHSQLVDEKSACEASGSLPVPRLEHATTVTVIESFAHLITEIWQRPIPISKERFAVESSHVGSPVLDEIPTISSRLEKIYIDDHNLSAVPTPLFQTIWILLSGF